MKKHRTKFAISVVVLAAIISISCSKDDGEESVKVPGKASLIAPENNKACEEVNDAGQVVFMWEASPNTTGYDLKITNLRAQMFINQYNITATSKAVRLTKGTPYSWQVTSKNEAGETAISDSWMLYLAGDGEVNYAPFPATVEAPAPGSLVTPMDGKTTIKWIGTDADGDNLTYTLQMDTVDGKQENIIVQNTSETTQTVDIEPQTVYYWRVISSDGDHTSTSAVYSFRTSN